MAKSFRILSLDGGGIRGLMTAVWLMQLEEKLGAPLRERFDLIAGTSTGAILACALASGMSAQAAAEVYRKRGREIFPAAPSRLWSRFSRVVTDGLSAPRYADTGLEAVLRSTFGEKRIGDVEHAVLLVTAYDVFRRKPEIFKSNKADHQMLKLWEIAKASSSAPSYFPAHILEYGGTKHPLVDGGVVANNPTACAIAEGLVLNRSGGAKAEDFVVASFGTGQNTRPIGIDDARTWGALQWAFPIVDVLMDGAADATHYIACQLIPSERYFRFQTELDKAYDDLDAADETNLNALMVIAQEYLTQPGSEQIDKLVPLLQI
jgi:patatin-like phospholipase/acyl hydrolase